MPGSRKLLEDLATGHLDDAYLDVRGEFLDAMDHEGMKFLEVGFASLPRRAGRALLDVGITDLGNGLVDLGTFRRCDLMAADLLSHRKDQKTDVQKLYEQGDGEERRMIFRSLPFLDDPALQEHLLLEAHRSNDEILFDAALLDTSLPARLLSEDAYNGLVLKAAFMERPVARLLQVESRVNQNLSAMLLDFMEEREAAGRPVWAGTLPLVARSPDPRLSAAIERESQASSEARRDAARCAAEILGQ